jgi:hypothetical protein
MSSLPKKARARKKSKEKNQVKYLAILITVDVIAFILVWWLLYIRPL